MLEYSVKAVTPDQLVSSLVGFLLSVQEKLVLKSALTRQDWIVFEVNFGRYQRHVAYLQHIQFRQLIREFPSCCADELPLACRSQVNSGRLLFCGSGAECRIKEGSLGQFQIYASCCVLLQS